jgi:hypothetical protein
MADREPLLNELRTMPLEAFSWLVSACATMGHVWPDHAEMGGFQKESQRSVARARQMADAYMTAEQEEQK